jgi:SH3-like domain-containing protein
MSLNRAFPFLALLLILSGCALVAPEPSATPPPPATETQSPTLPVIASITPQPSPTLTPSPTPFIPFEANTTVDYTNLRTNPGYLFAVDRMINRDVKFQVLGRSPGGEWIFVRTTAGHEGWIFAQLIETDQDLQAAPVIEPQGVQLITGKVTNPAGEPISGIQYAITQVTSAGTRRTDAMTGPDGIFYAFLPESASGTWNVAYTAVSCKSNTMDADCNCLGGVCGTSDPIWKNVDLPQTEALLFTWK